MRLGKLCLSGLGVVEAEQSHPQVIVYMGKCRVEAHSFAVTGGGILRFSCVEQCKGRNRLVSLPGLIQCPGIVFQHIR